MQRLFHRPIQFGFTRLWLVAVNASFWLAVAPFALVAVAADSYVVVAKSLYTE